jgi:hypothetical protein
MTMKEKGDRKRRKGKKMMTMTTYFCIPFPSLVLFS